MAATGLCVWRILCEAGTAPALAAVHPNTDEK